MIAIFATSGQVVANFDGVDVVKNVDQKRHQLKHPPAWAFDETVLIRAKELKARNFVIKTRDTRRTYSTSVWNFSKRCRRFDRGFGRQVFLPLMFWECENHDQCQTILPL